MDPQGAFGAAPQAQPPPQGGAFGQQAGGQMPPEQAMQVLSQFGISMDSLPMVMQAIQAIMSGSGGGAPPQGGM